MFVERVLMSWENCVGSKSDTEFCLAAFTHFTFVFKGLIADRAFAFTSFFVIRWKERKENENNLLEHGFTLPTFNNDSRVMFRLVSGKTLQRMQIITVYRLFNNKPR